MNVYHLARHERTTPTNIVYAGGPPGRCVNCGTHCPSLYEATDSYGRHGLCCVSCASNAHREVFPL